MQSGFLYRGHCLGIGTGDFYSYNEIILIGNILMVNVGTVTEIFIMVPVVVDFCCPLLLNTCFLFQLAKVVLVTAAACQFCTNNALYRANNITTCVSKGYRLHSSMA